MTISSDHHIPVVTTREDLNECFAPRDPFEASADLGLFPVFEDVMSDEEFFAPRDPAEPEAD